jgi:myo-inositol 2-dehydrogenase/D-chiro-inositol 1-dehydrogenase
MAVKIGFVGVGGIAHAHINSLTQIPGTCLTAFADLDRARAKAAADRFGGRAYRDWKKMFDSEELYAVYVCVPPHGHVGEEEAAAKRGWHLFIEKPVANDLATAKRIARAIKQNDVICSVGYHWRYYDTTNRAKQILKGKTVGMVLGYWLGSMPGVPWWRVQRQSGGQMVEQTTHIFDLARYLVGDIKRVQAAYALRALKDVPKLTVADVGTATLEFENGAVGQVSTTCLLKQGYTVGLRILTRDVILESDGGGLRVIQPGHTEHFQSAMSPMMVEDQVFVRAIQTGKRGAIRSDYDDALKTLAVTLAANESAKTGKPAAVRV